MPSGKVSLDAVWDGSAEDGTVGVSGTRLDSLACSGVSLDALLQVKALTASRNRLTSFDGVSVLAELREIDVSENSFRGIDVRAGLEALARCTQLRVLVCAANNISFVDLSLPNASPSWTALTYLDLSDNLLDELPSVVGCTALETLLLGGNRVSSLSNLADRIPPSLHRLELRNNALEDWYTLMELVFVVELSSITLKDNPCVEAAERDGFILEHLISAQLPNLADVDGSAPGSNPNAAALFEKLGDDPSRDDLLAFLCEVCPVKRRPATAPDVTESLGGTHTFVGGHSAEGLVSADDFNVLATKVHRLSTAVHVLRATDLTRRNRAVRVIQAFMKMVVVRNGISRKYGRAPQHVSRMRHQQRLALNEAMALAPRMERRVDAVEAAMRQVWVDLAHFRGYLHSKRSFAALKIQAAWKGWRMRRKYCAVRSEFVEFAKQYMPTIIKLQSFARMVIAKRSVRPMMRQMRRQHRLEVEVHSLQSEVGSLKALVQQLAAAVSAGGAVESGSEASRAAGSTGRTSNALRDRHASHGVAPATDGPAARSRRALSDSPVLASSASPSPLDGVSPDVRQPTDAPGTPSDRRALREQEQQQRRPVGGAVPSVSAVGSKPAVPRGHRTPPRVPESPDPKAAAEQQQQHRAAAQNPSALSLLNATASQQGNAPSWRRYADMSASTIGGGASAHDASTAPGDSSLPHARAGMTSDSRLQQQQQQQQQQQRGATVAPAAMPSTVQTDTEDDDAPTDEPPVALESTGRPARHGVDDGDDHRIASYGDADAYDDDFETDDTAAAMGVVDGGTTAVMTF